MTGRKKGLSIGAAMKQRMDSQGPEETPAAEPPVSDRFLWKEGDVTITPPPPEPDPLESFNTRLPRGLLRRLKVHTALEGGKIQDVVARALEEYLGRHDKKES